MWLAQRIILRTGSGTRIRAFVVDRRYIKNTLALTRLPTAKPPPPDTGRADLAVAKRTEEESEQNQSPYPNLEILQILLTP